jgi:hypothetical protein
MPAPMIATFQPGLLAMVELYAGFWIQVAEL